MDVEYHPIVMCHNHIKQFDEPMREWNIIIEELPDDNHQIYSISDVIDVSRVTGTESNILYDSITYDENKTAVRSTHWTNSSNLVLDMKVFLDKDEYANIYYIRQSGERECQTMSSGDVEVEIKAELNDYIVTEFNCVDRSVLELGSGNESANKYENICNICYETDKQLYNLDCHSSHNFCVECISQFYMRGKTCPMCRVDITKLQNLSNRMSILDIQLKSPDYEIECLNFKWRIQMRTYDIMYIIKLKSTAFTLGPLTFRSDQEEEYLLVKFILEEKLLITRDRGQYSIKYRSSIFGGLQQTLRNSENGLLKQQFTKYLTNLGYSTSANV